ncbi:phosphatidylserine decarboxylase proenzyme 2-like isoform X2 [Quercus robur]|uniref:phosphatidylserine decarboxylase proenzyme 2-like isoform X2 n=1 Tax=Quercus robur TaxID=38942 RepID=UPI00216229B5|nr:phosphatidylserine decarboxylase proenzyme 2-like isoform X2 [Quercus robur]
MGHGSSKGISEQDLAKEEEPSRLSRLKNKLHLHRHRRHADNGSAYKALIDADDFAGIANLTLKRAEMKFKDKWMACVSLGEQTFRTDISDQTDSPVWNSEKKLLLEKNGPHIARISVFETNRLSSSNIVGYREIDLLEFVTRDSDSDFEVFDLLDPSSSDMSVGSIFLSCSVEDPIETEKRFARRILSIVDYNEDGKLSFSEFSELINAFGNQQAATKKEELFKVADKNGDGNVSMDELADLLAIQQEKEPLISCCPVCGEILEVSHNLNTMIHLTLCFDEGTGNQVMTGGFLTDKQASSGWMFKLSEWAHFSSYDIGLNSGASASHIVVFDRRTKRLVEELINGKIVLSMRAIYQSKFGLGLMDTGAKELLQSISEKQGRRMSSTESTKDIPKFVESFKDQINLAEVKYPLEHFKTFNEFFIRELKPGARPIACMERDDIAVCAADSRLMAFKSADDSLRFWIKGRKFSIQGLLGQDVSSGAFIDGPLVIFRLAPQVAFVAIGATMVGSISFSKEKGDHVRKGDEFGYFSFGGSTVICAFEKGAIEIDEDLLSNSARSLETLVYVGMTLGVSTKKPSGNGLPNLGSCNLGD